MGRKRRARTRKRQRAASLRRNGLQAFKNGNYSEAIEIWGRVKEIAPDKAPTLALAEAYFRRGLNRLYGGSNVEAGLGDLRCAVDLQPDEARYIYHLGLSLHRQGDLDDAIDAYRTVHEGEGEFASRAVYPLALALFQRGDDVKDTAVWSRLSDEEQAMLGEVETFNRRPYTVSPEAPLLWHALAALDAEEYEDADEMLERVLEKPANSLEQGMAHYYLGVLEGQKGNWYKSRRQWGAARAAGLEMDRLESNLHESYHRLAEELLLEDDAAGAMAAAKEALRHGPSFPSLEELLSQAHQRLAHQAVSSGNWKRALKHWKAADKAEDGSFRLAYNLALAHERDENFIAAAERWREALRRRPRLDDDPDAITDEQVARLWRRTAEAYRKAGEFDEAVQVCRHAVKWNPDSSEARMTLADALLFNGQTQAAQNELDRILEREPDNVHALLQRGEVAYAESTWWYGEDPTYYWDRVLELEPDNGEALQKLLEYYREQAEHDLQWGDIYGAIDVYEQALEYDERNAPILASLGRCYLRMDDAETAWSYFEEALTSDPGSLGVYEEIVQAWLDVEDPGRAWEFMEKAESSVENITYTFYLAVAHYILYDYPSEVARPWLDRAIEAAPSHVPILMIIGEMAMSSQEWDLCREYLERAIDEGQKPGDAYLLMGILSLQERDDVKAETYWREAAKIARLNDDDELLERVDMTRMLFSMPPGLADFLMSGRGLDSVPPDFFL